MRQRILHDALTPSPLQTMNLQRRRQQPLIILFLGLLPSITNAVTSFGSRHSYSLTTFDPSGNLDQVVRAIRASTLGVAIAALCLPANESNSEVTATTASSDIPNSGGVYISIPLRFLSTSPLLIDDATPRIVPLSPNLILVHTGVGADGRALSEIAIELVLDYKYLYGEEMDVQGLLAGLSSKMQEMTMKGGTRPYGCALLICALGEGGGNAMMYRVDPSGAVVLLSSVDYSAEGDSDGVERRRSVTLMGNWEAVKQKKKTIQQELEMQQIDNEEQIQRLLVDAVRKTCVDQPEWDDASLIKTTPVLFASFDRDRGLEIKRITS